MNPCSVVQYIVFSLKFCNYGTCCKFGNVYKYPCVCSCTTLYTCKKKNLAIKNRDGVIFLLLKALGLKPIMIEKVRSVSCIVATIA